MLQQYKNILVPIDGSFEAELAFKKAVEVVKKFPRKSSLNCMNSQHNVILCREGLTFFGE